MPSPIYLDLKQRLESIGAHDPSYEARILLEDIARLNWSDIITADDLQLSQDHKDQIDRIMSRREQGEPLSRILGQRQFWGLDFSLNEATLDPRPDTEVLVEKALSFARTLDADMTILDLGTGTGCIPISLASELTTATVQATDISAKALEVATKNAKANNVDHQITFKTSDWFEQISGKFDLITSNPPYIDTADIANLAPEVKNHDPILALDGGEKGLDPYKIIFSQINSYLKPTGRAFLEIGYDQCGYIERLAKNYRIRIHAIHPDYAGIPRVVEISCGDK